MFPSPIIEIESVIPACYDGKLKLRDPDEIAGAMVHRVGIDCQTGAVLGYDAISISNAFTGKDPKWADVAKATGSQNAYSLMIGGDLGPEPFDGKIWQLMPLNEIGYHARRFSSPYLGIGCIGDFRKNEGRPMSPKQRASLVDLLALLCAAFSWNPYQKIKGHGEVGGAHSGAKAPGKPAACPGDLVDMYAIRDDVATLGRESARRQLADAGLVFT